VEDVVVADISIVNTGENSPEQVASDRNVGDLPIVGIEIPGSSSSKEYMTALPSQMNDGPISSNPSCGECRCGSGRVAFDDLFRIKNIGSFISRPQIGLLGVAPHDSWSTAVAVA
jgi:hypothetical protein